MKYKNQLNKNLKNSMFTIMMLLTTISYIPIISADCSGSVNGNIIYINDCQNFTELNISVNNEALLINLGNGEWFLNANLINNNTTNTFYINESDVSWLKINSTKIGSATTFWYYETDGKTEINNTKITSWNIITNTPHEQSVRTDPRSYIYAKNSYSKMNITNSNISNLGYQRYDWYFGVTYYSSSNNTINNNTIFSTHRGIALVRGSNNNTISNNTIRPSPFLECFGSFIWATSRFNLIKDNNITTPDVPGSTSDSCYGLYLWSANNNTVINNTITTNGQLSNGIDINSESNYLHNNNISIKYGSGLMIESLGKYNTLLDNIFFANNGAFGAQLKGASNNLIYGGSIISNTSYDYYIYSGSLNKFKSTNFTKRKIYLTPTTNFNYSNSNETEDVFLTTNVSSTTTLTREIKNWTKNNIIWNETSSISGVNGTYKFNGLYQSTTYNVYIDDILKHTLDTNENGELPLFTNKLLNKYEIRVTIAV